MFETHPKFSLLFVATLLVAAFALPAVMVFAGQTAAGLQMALLLGVLWVIRLILVPNMSSWLDAARFPMLLLAVVAALNFTPQDGAVDVLTRTGLLALIVVPATGLALLFRRPKTLGFSVNREFWVILAALAILLGFNHLWRLPDAQGAALVADLVVLAALGNLAPFGRVPWQTNKTAFALCMLSFAIVFSSFTVLTDGLADGRIDLIKTLIILSVNVAFWAVFFAVVARRQQSPT